MKANFANDDFAPENLNHAKGPPTCIKCAEGELMSKLINTAFWRDAGLLVIRNIPAMVCSACGEEYVADETALGLDRMYGQGFADKDAVDSMTVPVFDYAAQGAPDK